MPIRETALSTTPEPLCELIRRTPIVSTHEHHRDGAFQQSLNLDRLLTASYVGWGPMPPGDTPDARRDWLSRVRHNSYFVWLEKALAAIYGIELIAAETWQDLSFAISTAHRDPAWHLRLLREHARYELFLEDAYWAPGSDENLGDMAVPVYRIDMWLAGFHPEAHDHDGINPRDRLGRDFPTLDDYEDCLRAEIRARRPAIAALKCAAAYERTLEFGPPRRDEAKAVFGRSPAEVPAGGRRLFGDFILHVALEEAAKLDLPVQVHTGLAMLAGSNPLLFEPIIDAYSDVRFVLFHGGFPWVRHVGALAHNHPANVIIDLCWLPIISTSAAVSALHEYIELLPDIGHLTWGGDCWTGEEACGAAMALRHVLGRCLAEKIADQDLRPRDAETIAHRIMHANARSIYGLAR